MIDDLKFEAPFTCIISGPSGSGKSSFCIRLLQNLDTVCTERHFAGGIIWCYSERVAVPSQGGNVRFHEGVPAKFGDAQCRPCLVILDDPLNVVYSEQVCDLLMKGSHHSNISVILITQNLFHQGSIAGTYR